MALASPLLQDIQCLEDSSKIKLSNKLKLLIINSSKKKLFKGLPSTTQLLPLVPILEKYVISIQLQYSKNKILTI